MYWRFWPCPPACSQPLGQQPQGKRSCSGELPQEQPRYPRNSHYLWTVRSSILAEPSCPNLGPVPTKSQSRTRSSHHYKKRRKRKELVVTCWMLSGIPRPGVSWLHSLQARSASLSFPKMGMLLRQWEAMISQLHCQPVPCSICKREKYKVLVGTIAYSSSLSYMALVSLPNQTQQKTATYYIYIYKGKKKSNIQIPPYLQLWLCMSVILPCTSSLLRSSSFPHNGVQLFCGEEKNVA